MSIAVRMVGITKSFPGTLANDKVDFDVKEGEVHSLLGENGAGKTVLMSILYGLYKPDEGQIFVKGQEVKIDNPAKAISLGIGMVHQHFMLVPSLTVAENIVLGREPQKHRFWLDTSEANKATHELSEKYGLEVDPKAVVSTLPVGVQQRVEILKALLRGAEILILDEPTSVLTPQEVEGLFKAIATLKDQGKSVVFISHKLKEVCRVSDRVTVLRKGKVAGTLDKTTISVERLAKMMVGRDVPVPMIEKKPIKGRTILQVEGLRAFNERKIIGLQSISFEVHESEILGVAGVEGNGQTELIEVLVGLRKPEEGRIVLDGKPINNASIQERLQKGFSIIPEDRQKTGLILDFGVSENLILGRQNQPPFAKKWFTLDLEKEAEFANELIKEYSIQTPTRETLVRYLSGGTQQRVVVAREFSREPRFIIASQPTRGLDIGATEYVHKRLIEMRDRGCAILLISADLDEIFALSDRIVVIYEGKIVAVKQCDNTNELEIGLLMTGATHD
jgi:general nucleoside transport system ATP-binding protein